jgi:hypothetical protein
VPLSRHEPGTGIYIVLREVIRPLKAWDAVECSFVMLEAGAMLSGCRIQPNGRMQLFAEIEPYVMEFHSRGRQYACPLFSFQPRTQTVGIPTVPLPA